MQRKSPPQKEGVVFLPGSRSDGDSTVEALKKKLERNNLPKKKKRFVFNSKLDIKRAYIIDAFLDKPRWNDEDVDVHNRLD